MPPKREKRKADSSPIVLLDSPSKTINTTTTTTNTCTCQERGCIICAFNDNTNLHTILPLTSTTKSSSLQCPVCSQTFAMDEREMDKHVEDCLSSSVLAEESKAPIPTPSFIRHYPVEEEEPLNSDTENLNEDAEEEDEEEEEEEEEEYNRTCKFCGEYYYGHFCHCQKKPKMLPTSYKPKQHIYFGPTSTTTMPPTIPAPVPSFNFSHTIPPSYTVTPMKLPKLPTPTKPFSVSQPLITCPYLSCMGKMLSSQFTNHVLTSHVHNRDQQYACPLCTSLDMPVYHVNKKTNLYQHVQMAHVGGRVISPPMHVTPPVPPKVEAPKKEIQVNLIEEVLAKDLGQECSICFEDMHASEKVARLECLCVFHMGCLNKWFEKQRRCPLHENFSMVDEDDVQVVSS